MQWNCIPRKSRPPIYTSETRPGCTACYIFRYTTMDVYYCGFNGFRQVPSSAASDTLTSLTPHTKGAKKIVDVAICWNYLVVAESDTVTKYGLVNTKPGLDRLNNPPGGNVSMVQLSATPRHIFSVTDNGECWTHEEGKGWRRRSA